MSAAFGDAPARTAQGDARFSVVEERQGRSNDLDCTISHSSPTDRRGVRVGREL